VLVDQIRVHGRVPWSWTGLRLQPVRDFERDMWFGGDRGVIVAGTDPDSPARRAGLQSRDRILAVDGVPLDALTEEDLPAVRRTLALLPAGTPVRLAVERGEECLEVAVEPREKGSIEGSALECRRWDFSAKEINQFDNPHLWFHRRHGVFVYGVKSPGNAASAGLRRDDILLKIGDREVPDLETLRAVHEEAIEGVARESRLVFTVLRDGLLRQIVVDFARDYERR
jgi:S1-C subfamily serine protease